MSSTLPSTTTPATAKSTANTGPHSGFRLNDWLPELCLALCVASVSVLLYYQVKILWDRPHFQFFPLAWGVFAMLVYQRATVAWSTHRWRLRSGMACWLAGLVVGAGAAILFSPWLGHVSAMLCIIGWGLLRLSDVPATRWLAWSGLLLITLPMPGQLDTQLIIELQRISSTSAGALLDLMRVPHLRQGTLIEIRTNRLFVDEACSGVDSLYSLLAIAMVMILWMQRPLIVGLFVLLSVPLWAWLGNVIRLTTIVYLLDCFEIDLSHGWRHTLLGLATFSLSSLSLFATMNAMGLLFRRFSHNTMPATANDGWYRWYNNVVCYPGAVTAADQEPDSNGKKQKSSSMPSQESWMASLIARRVSFCVAVIGAIAIAGLTGLGLAGDLKDNFQPLPHYEAALVDSIFNEQGLPENLVAAKRSGYRTEDRSLDNFIGEHSRMWVYQHAANEIQFSVDFPFRGFHPLWVCYTNAGQQIIANPVPLTSQVILTNDGSPAIQRVTLQDSLGSNSYLWFLLFDASGTCLGVNSPGLSQNRIAQRLRPIIEGMFEPEPVTYQFQMLVTSGRELNESELDDYVKVFEAALPHAQNQVKQLINAAAAK